MPAYRLPAYPTNKLPRIALLAWIWGCSNGLPTALEDALVIEGLRYEGKTTLDPQGHALISVSLRNETSGPKRIVAGTGCNPIPQLFRSPARTGKPVWDGFDSIAEELCLGVQLDFFLIPGEEYQFTSLLIHAEVKGDSLESGTYHVAASVIANQDTIRLAAGEMAL